MATTSLVDVPAGIQNIQVSFVGYEPKTVFEIEVTPARPAVVNVVLKPASIAIEEAEVVGSRRPNVAEAPLSVRSLGTNEIKRNPAADVTSAAPSVPCRVWRPFRVSATTSSSAAAHRTRTVSTSTALRFPTSTTSPPKARAADRWV